MEENKYKQAAERLLRRMRLPAQEAGTQDDQKFNTASGHVVVIHRPQNCTFVIGQAPPTNKDGLR